MTVLPSLNDRESIVTTNGSPGLWIKSETLDTGTILMKRENGESKAGCVKRFSSRIRCSVVVSIRCSAEYSLALKLYPREACSYIPISSNYVNLEI